MSDKKSNPAPAAPDAAPADALKLLEESDFSKKSTEKTRFVAGLKSKEVRAAVARWLSAGCGDPACRDLLAFLIKNTKAESAIFMIKRLNLTNSSSARQNMIKGGFRVGDTDATEVELPSEFDDL